MTAEIINAMVAIVLWVMFAARIRLLRGPGPARALGLTLLTMAMAQTTRIPFVHHGIESALQSTVGLTGVSMLLKHSFAIVAAANMLALVETPRARPSPAPGHRGVAGVRRVPGPT